MASKAFKKRQQDTFDKGKEAMLAQKEREREKNRSFIYGQAH